MTHASKYVSVWELIKHGVPQGSDLGPLLFLFCKNNLPQSVKGMAIPTLYADDTSFLIPNVDPEQVGQDVKVVFEIIKKNGLIQIECH
jgi:hypothetical protein